MNSASKVATNLYPARNKTVLTLNEEKAGENVMHLLDKDRKMRMRSAVTQSLSTHNSDLS